MIKSNKYDVLEEINAYFVDIGKYKPLSRGEEIELSNRIKKGDEEALSKLVNSNLKFVVKCAKLYRDSGVPFSDLISEGNIGLIKAAKKYDGNKDNKFISYAVWWVRASIQECINKYRGKLDEINHEDFKTDYIHSSQLISNEFEEEVSEVNSRIVTISELMKSLKNREIEVLTKYFGLNDGQEKTLDEISQELHLTSERVRQIKDRALVKLRVNALKSNEFDVFKSLR